MQEPSWLRRWLLRRLYRGMVASMLRDHVLLDRVAAGDPGAPARVVPEHVAAGATAALRHGRWLVATGVLSLDEYQRSQLQLEALVIRAQRFRE